MTHFMFLADMNGPRWMLMGIVVKMALSVSILVYSSFLITNILPIYRLDYVSDCVVELFLWRLTNFALRQRYG
jgi:hypothetical protein